MPQQGGNINFAWVNKQHRNRDNSVLLLPGTKGQALYTTASSVHDLWHRTSPVALNYVDRRANTAKSSRGCCPCSHAHSAPIEGCQPNILCAPYHGCVQWMPLEELPKSVVSFKQDVYRQVRKQLHLVHGFICMSHHLSAHGSSALLCSPASREKGSSVILLRVSSHSLRLSNMITILPLSLPGQPTSVAAAKLPYQSGPSASLVSSLQGLRWKGHIAMALRRAPTLFKALQ